MFIANKDFEQLLFERKKKTKYLYSSEEWQNKQYTARAQFLYSQHFSQDFLSECF